MHQIRQLAPDDGIAAACDAAGVGLWERDADGVLRRLNTAAYRALGLAPADPRRPDEIEREVVAGADRAHLAEAWAAHVGHGRPYRPEFRVRHADGRWRWLAAQGQALRDGAGAVLGMMAVTLDVSAHREADALRRERERIEQASRDKSAFMARMSHELRTPLNAVLGFTRLLDGDAVEPPSARQRERLRRIADAGERLLGLVDDMLELGRLEAEPAAVAADDVALDAVIEAALALAAPAAYDQHVHLRREPGQPGLHARGERRRLLRALTLVLEHALGRSRPLDEIALALWCEGHGAAARVGVSLRDRGPDLTPEQHLWLFEAFAPAAGDTGDEDNPARLNLARRLMEAMGGSIDAQPAADGGTLYRLGLPRATPAEVSDPGPQAGQSGPGPAPAPTGIAAAPPMRPLDLLCIEDNPVNLQLVRELVGLCPGIALRTAEDGESGLAAARTQPPDVVLLDMQLPDLNGIEVLQRLRAQPATAASTCIALSADVLPAHIEQALAAGFDDYWTKPIDFARFLADLGRLAAQPR